MTVLLDTNIILDALQERHPFDTAAKDILKRAQNGDFTCLITANATADIFYLYSRARDMKSARIALEFLLKQYKVVSVSHDDCLNALSLPIVDYEDALVVACAQKAEASYIITRDDKLMACELPIKVITPIELQTLLADAQI